MAMHEWGFRAAHIPGSVHYSTVEEADKDLALNDEIVVFCTDPDCVAGQFACKWLGDADTVAFVLSNGSLTLC